MESLAQDIRYGMRTLLRSPGFASVAIIALALGIGANSAIFSVVNAVLLRPLPYREPDRLVWVSQYFQRSDSSFVLFPDFIGWREQSGVFEDMAAYGNGDFNVTGGPESERVAGVRVTANLFSLLDVHPDLGRALLPEEDRPGGAPVVVLSHALWQRRFGGDRNAIGKTIILDSNPFTVVGVMPSTFQFPDEPKAELLIPTALLNKIDWSEKQLALVRVIARLKPGITLDQALANLSIINQRLVEDSPQNLARNRASVQIRMVPLHRKLVGNAQPVLLLLLGAVGFVLLVACANVANLQLARAMLRQREMAVRAALGAGRIRLIRQLLTESVLLTSVGGFIGLAMAYWSLDLLSAFANQSVLLFKTIGIDRWVLAFTFGAAVLTGILSGLAPAVAASRPDLSESLKQGGPRVTGSYGHQRLRSFLVVFEIALTMVLLVGFGLLMRSFLRLTGVNPGFDSSHVLAARLEHSEYNYDNVTLQLAFFRQLLRRIETLPGVESVGAASHLPLLGYTNRTTVAIDGQPPPLAQDAPIPIGAVSSEYFRAMRIPVILGRHFTEQDSETAPLVVIVNESFAHRFLPGEDPIGKRVKRGLPQGPWLTIVGVVRDIRHLGLDTDPTAEIFVPYYQYMVPWMTVVIRGQADVRSLVPAIRAQAFTLDKNLPLYDIATMEERLQNSVISRRQNMWLLGIFAGLALILALVGVYGMMAYSVSQRTQEIGVRMTLGASRTEVLKLILRQGMVLTLTGVGCGLAIALALSQLLSGMLYGIRPTDPLTLVGVSFVLTATTLLACYIPARRAVKVDPNVALRHE